MEHLITNVQFFLLVKILYLLVTLLFDYKMEQKL